MTRRFAVRLVLALALAVAASGFAVVAAQHEGRFFVVGHVNRPGAYELKADMTVGEALDAAGGFSANRTATAIDIHRVTNGEKETLRVTLNDPVLHNDTINVK
jgi:protein involved in polysaccharide export with SLBB domain